MIVFELEIGDTLRIAVVLERTNLDRMKSGDPVTLGTGVGGALGPIHNPKNVELLVAYEDEAGIAHITNLMQQNRPDEVIQHLMRGLQYTASDGLRAPLEPTQA